MSSNTHHQATSTAVLTAQRTTLVLDTSSGKPVITYWGKRLSANTTDEMLIKLQGRQALPASPTNEVPLTLCPTLGEGFTGQAGIECFDSEQRWAVNLKVEHVKQHSSDKVTLRCVDSFRSLSVTHTLSLCQHSDVLSIDTRVTNNGDTSLNLNWCAAATLPVPSHMHNILGFEGHWANEFQRQQSVLKVGAYVRENRRGRTSHDSFPGLIMHAPHCNESCGEALAFHLGWSGNHKMQAELMADGRAYIQMGERLLPGEVTLASGEHYRSPSLHAAYSSEGFNSLSQQFHRYVRKNLLTEKVRNTPRPVHYNTWEGIYFDHDVDTLKQLAHKAASLGVERFVLDDGWFIGRNDDTAGLGDWYVDETVYPDGLHPVIEKVNELGMEFGLWVEPEMVNPDSNLFRAHPDWAIGTQHNQDMGFRNQLVLDLSNQDVFDYLYERLDSLLSEYNIGYLKWDMNRDVLQAGDIHDRPVVHKQTHAVYALVDKLRQAHPAVEIESCCSGGGRADYGILKRTDRIWTSDSNDALVRLRIQQGFSHFFPAELMGSHAGPRHCHITHRHLPMDLRAATALFGHMGMEMDLRELNEQETATLKAAVALYKQHRALLHTGDLYRLDLPGLSAHHEQIGFGIVSDDKSDALFSYSLLNEPSTSMPGMFRFDGLDPTATYRLDIVWPIKPDNPDTFWPAASVFNTPTHLPKIDGQTFTGESLMNFGLQLPRLVPQTTLVFQLREIVQNK